MSLGGFADPDAGLRALLKLDVGDGERLGLASGGGSEERKKKECMPSNFLR